MVIGGRPVSDPGDEDPPRIIRKKSDGGGNGRGADRGGGDSRGRKDDR